MTMNKGIDMTEEEIKKYWTYVEGIYMMATVHSSKGEPLSESQIKELIKIQLSDLNTDIDQLYEIIKHEIDIRVAQTSDKGILLSNKNENHIPWLEEALKDTTRTWPHWKNYYNQVLCPPSKPNKKKIAEKVNEETNAILAMLEDPMREGCWDNRGLVVGDVQMGKTSNYIGLMAKAVDAGYKVLIVLAGATNDLRRQTQLRIDERLLGYVTSNSTLNYDAEGKFKEGRTIQPSTTSDARGDYISVKTINDIAGDDCHLFVIKKNGSVLRNIIRYLKKQKMMNGGNRIPVPLLLIDDEADYGSPDTKAPKKDPLTDEIIDGKDLDPTIINRYIRVILSSFEKSSYVAYTATPYANIFGLPNHDKEKECYDNMLDDTLTVGEDLFPRNFIYRLGIPSNYIGPERVFGVEEDFSDELPIVIDVQERFPDDFIEEPPKRPTAASKYILRAEPDSLFYAIKCFIISASVKKARGCMDITPHNTMLVHVHRLVKKQAELKEWVIDYVDELKNLFTICTKKEQDEFLDELHDIWELEYLHKFDIIRDKVKVSGLYPLDWENVATIIPQFVKTLGVRVVNGYELDKLDYDNHPAGLNVIAIGGDKLSRGLTLEGLSVSYFIREAGTYDTLTQMGRWFGYRDGYVDVCRLFATTKTISNFKEITYALDDLNSQFKALNDQHLTPLDYGLHVLTNPLSKILVTARNKSRNVIKHEVSFSGSPVPTAYLPCNSNVNEANMHVMKDFVSALGEPTGRRSSCRSEFSETGNFYWSKVPAKLVCEKFLESNFQIDERNSWFTLNEISTFIKKMNANNEVSEWTVVAVNGEGEQYDLPNGITVRKSLRSLESKKDGCFELQRRRIASGSDESFDLTTGQFESALKETNKERDQKGKKSTQTPNSRMIRRYRSHNKALLLLYFISLEIEGIIDTIPGFMISFPELGHRDMDYSYWGNTVYAKMKNNSVGEELVKAGFIDD